jgi:hypothetical protein
MKEVWNGVISFHDNASAGVPVATQDHVRHVELGKALERMRLSSRPGLRFVKCRTKKAMRRLPGSPQRLKPECLAELFGTAEAVPFPVKNIRRTDGDWRRDGRFPRL